MADTKDGAGSTPVNLVPRGSIHIQRKLYTQEQLENEYTEQGKPTTLGDRMRRTCVCSYSCFVKILLGYFPLIDVLRNYAWKKSMTNDFISGLSVSFLQMPQGLALGLLASLPAVYGLYTTFYPVLIYLVFGTCRHVSMGTNALLSLLTAGIVERELEVYLKQRAGGTIPSTPLSVSLETSTDSLSSTTDSLASVVSEEEIVQFKVGVATAIAFISGLFLLGMGVLKMGFITSYMSPPFVRGFTTAAAIHIVTSQIPKMFNIKVPAHTGAGKIVKTYIDIFKNIHNSNPADVIISAISFVFLLGVTIFINERYRAKLRVPVPVQLIIVVLSTLISHYTNLEDLYGISIVGNIPLGLPAPRIPNTDVLSSIVVDSFIIAILAFTLTITLAQLMAEQHEYHIDTNQELISYGLSNFLSSFFLCIPNCTGPPRTMILSNCGTKSTLNGLVTAVFILIVLLAAGHLFSSLPIAVLAMMIATAVKNLLLQVTQLPVLWRLSKPDFLIWVITCLTSVFGDLDIGIAVGMGVSILSFVIRNQTVSGSVGSLSAHEDLVLFGKNRKGVKEGHWFKIFFFPSQLFFANVGRFTKELYAKALDPSAMTPIDTNTAEDIENQAKPSENESKIFSTTQNESTTFSTTQNGSKSYSTPQAAAATTSHTPSVEDNVVKYVILDCSAMTYMDMAGANAMLRISGQYRKVGVTLLLARCPAYTLRLLDGAGYFDAAGRNTIFCDVHDAIASIQRGYDELQ